MSGGRRKPGRKETPFPERILPGSEEERMARHRHAFIINGLDEEARIEAIASGLAEFDLDRLNRARGWVAFMKRRKEEMERDARLKEKGGREGR